MGYPRKNPNIGNWVYTFLKKNAGILEFAALPFKILEKKNKLSPFEILQNRAFITNGHLITITPA